MSQFHDPRQKKPKTAGDLAVAAISQDGVIATGNYARFEDISSQTRRPASTTLSTIDG